VSASPDSLENVIKYLTENPSSDDRIYSCIVPIDRQKLTEAILTFERVEAMKPEDRSKKNHKSLEKWSTQKNRVKGKAFERIMRVLLPTGTIFTTWGRVQTTTNEIDVLVGLGPKSKWVTIFDNWGTHFVCECKSEKGHFSVSWVDKLYTVLSTHNSYAGLLVSKKSPTKTGNGRRALDKIRMLALLKKVVIIFDMKDIKACEQGSHILAILHKKYIEVTTGAANLSLL
jgi:hypothetical protein